MIGLALLAGVGTGLVLSAPVGPMGALALYQLGQRATKASWLLALGVCSGDALLAFLASFGTELPLPEGLTAGLAALMLGGMGLYLLLRGGRAVTPTRSAGSFGLGFGATLLHPANLLGFGAVFQWFNQNGLEVDGLGMRLLLAAGVFAGAMTMWALVLHLAALAWGRFDLERFQSVFRRVLGAVCLLSAAGILLRYVV